LRSSWATDHLSNSSGIDWSLTERGLRKVAYIDPDHPGEQFPVSCPISRIFFLVRPRASRLETSAVRRISAVGAYAAFVAATSPLLLSKYFPVEAGLIGALIRKTISSIPCAELESGQDVVLTPAKAWAKLLSC
jgi:hypothetical protein